MLKKIIQSGVSKSRDQRKKIAIAISLCVAIIVGIFSINSLIGDIRYLNNTKDTILVERPTFFGEVRNLFDAPKHTSSSEFNQKESIVQESTLNENYVSTSTKSIEDSTGELSEYRTDELTETIIKKNYLFVR